MKRNVMQRVQVQHISHSDIICYALRILQYRVKIESIKNANC